MIFLDEGIEAMSTSRLVLLLKKELVPRTISEDVQSRKGLTSHSSSSSLLNLPFPLTTLTHLSNQLLPESKIILISAMLSVIFFKASSLNLLSSSI